MSANPYDAARAAIDKANSEDPRAALVDGHPFPQEVLYSMRMVEWAGRLAPEASEELLLAARAQHVCRWKTPRSSFPEGRTGYLQWREGLKKFHAGMAAQILREAGYPEESVKKVQSLLVRKNLASDPEGQTLEDAACLVFLEFEFADFAVKTDEEKMIDILKKTWGKMSSQARELALQQPYGERETALLKKALGA